MIRLVRQGVAALCGGLVATELLSVMKSAQKCARCHQHNMQTKGAVIFIRQARMRTIRVQHFEQPVDVILPVLGPLVPVGR